MKTGIKLRISLLTLMAVVFVFLHGCQKSPIYTDTVEDMDGNVYGTKKIGNQVWMTENLRTISFRDGSWMLTKLYDDYEWASAGAACTFYPFYETEGLDSEAEVIDAYGFLYNWIAVTDSRGLCPTGWRVPTTDDWDELIEYLGGEEVAGGKLKSKRTAPDAHPRWDSPNTDATDNYGFSAVPSGYRTSLGQFDFLGSYAEYWTSTEYNDDLAHTYYLYNGDAYLSPGYGRKRAGYAVRCIAE